MIYDIHTGDDLYGRLAMLQAGDEVVVHAGTYPSPGFVQVTWAGTAAAPIVIHSAPGEHVVLQGTFAQNLLNIDGSYWTFQGFEITGASHGLRLHSVDHATIEDNVIHDVGDVGISCNFEPDNCDSVSIIHNEIYRTGMDNGTGEGMYLGCNSGACLFTNGLVSDNYVHDTGGSQGDGIEIKEGAHDNVVSDNVIIRTMYPGITMYGFGSAGGPNVVERNLVWHTMDNGIQIVGQIVVRNNIVLGYAAAGIASKPSQTYTPHDLTIVDNTVVGPGIGVRGDNWTTETGQVVADNALDCATPTQFTAGAGAIVMANLAATDADFGNPAMGDVYPTASSTLLGMADAAHQATDDFNGTHRMGADVGAYEHTGPTNPGWIVTEGFKTPPEVASGDGPPAADDFPVDHPSAKSGCGCNGSDPSSLLLALAPLVQLLRKRR